MSPHLNGWFCFCIVSAWGDTKRKHRSCNGSYCHRFFVLCLPEQFRKLYSDKGTYGRWFLESIPVQIHDYKDLNSMILNLQKRGYSPIGQYTKIYTTTPGIKVIAVPLASKLHPHITKVNDTLIMNTVVVLKMFTPKHYIRIPNTKKALVIGYASHPAILYNMTLTIKNDTNEGTLTLIKSTYKNGKIVFLNRAKVKFDRKTHRILSVTTSGEKIQPQGFWRHIACELACEALLAGGVVACCSVVPELCAACMALVDTSDLAICYAACLRLGD